MSSDTVRFSVSVKFSDSLPKRFLEMMFAPTSPVTAATAPVPALPPYV